MRKDKLKHIKKSGFKTPKGYFETLEDAVFAKMIGERLPKKDGFKSPKGYFDSIEDNVFEKLNLDKEKKEPGFKVPENYLDSVEDNILKTIKNEQKEPKLINFTSVFLKRIVPVAAAASLLIFIFINYKQTPNIDLDQLASTEIEQWIDDDLITFDTYEITEVFDDVELKSEPIFEEEEVLDYLNGTDIESLILEN